MLTFSHLMREENAGRKPGRRGPGPGDPRDQALRRHHPAAARFRAREDARRRNIADLNRIIEDTVRIIERPAHLRDIEITLDLDPELPPVWVDADLIKQVIMNMLVNAQHAIEDEGQHHGPHPPLPSRRARSPAREPVPMVEIAIIDTGCGIPEKNLQRIFDPFFTSKEVGKGTGLGLSVSHGIVKAHGGTIEVESTVGRGIHVPRLPARGSARRRDASEQRERSMSARILVVDDEEIVVRSCLRILGGGDYEVEAAQDGMEALSKIEDGSLRRAHPRHHDAEDGRPGGAAAGEGDAPGHRRHHDHRAVADRDRGEGDEARGLRLPAQALRPGRAEARGASARWSGGSCCRRTST